MTATSGLRCLELSESAGRLGCLQRMLLGTSRWVSTRCWLTWKAKTTPQGRLLFQLVPRTHHIEETESGLWRTPAGSDGVGGIMKMHMDKDGHYKLRDQVQGINREFWPTPTARDYKGGRGLGTLAKAGRNATNSLPDSVNAEMQATGSLNPEWVEHYLMGYPRGWTNLTSPELQKESQIVSTDSGPSEMQSFPKSHLKSYRQWWNVRPVRTDRDC